MVRPTRSVAVTMMNMTGGPYTTVDERQMDFSQLPGVDLRSFMVLMLVSILPGAACAITMESLSIGRPDIVIPVILCIEIPLAIWISGFMGAADRETIRSTFTAILSHDFASMSASEILSSLFWGENSVVMFIFRIWLAVVAAMLCTITFGQVEPILQKQFEMPQVMVLTISFSLFSYVFIRNICERTIRDQIGHALLASVFSGIVFSGMYFMF